ncbi:MAG: stage V sporulation protein AC [Bacillota bacterium]|jgi:stage V sporulation protein AC
MSNQQKKKLTQAQQEYQSFAQTREPQRRVWRNFLRAFLVGGLICMLGQGIQQIFITYFNFTKTTAGNPTVAVLIILSILLTGLGIYDHIAQWAGAGTAVPVTGFANSMVSSAIEHRSEGYVLGVSAKMFELAGSVIVFGVFSAFIVALLKLAIMALGRMS